MSVRIRITLIFAFIVFAILGLVCGSIYYFSYTSRIKNSKARLNNFAITTGRLFSQYESFDDSLIKKIDSATTLTLVNKTVEAFDHLNNRIYLYSDIPNDSLAIDPKILNDAENKSDIYFTIGEREAIAYDYVDKNFNAVIVVAAYDKDGIGTLKQLQLILICSFFGGMLAAIIIGYWFSTNLLRPIRKIADEVHEISAQNLTRRIHSANGTDEWSYFSATINELLNRLQESFEIQGRFISNASHEISTPLSSISSQLEVSLQRDRDAAEYRQVMQSVYQDVLQLNKLTQTLLEFAKASGTAAGIEINLVRIDEILLLLKSELVKLDKRYTVLLEFENLPEEEEKLLVFGNEPLLFTAVKNIVVNACKYSLDDQAKVKLMVDEAEIIIEITDNGKGIKQDEMENIFQPFYRSNDNFSVKGFGLGLSLASRIIKLHKGYIDVISSVDGGSTFTIHLPSANKVA